MWTGVLSSLSNKTKLIITVKYNTLNILILLIKNPKNYMQGEIDPSVACRYNVQSVKCTSSMLWMSCKCIKNN